MGAALTIGAGILTAGSQISAGNAQSAYQNAQAKNILRQAQSNELAVERQIAYDTQATAEEISSIRRKGRKDFGTQLAIMAAGGMSTLSKSAMDIIASSAISEDRDVANLHLQNILSANEKRLQARLNMYDAQGQAAGLKAAAKATKKSAYISAFGTILGTAAQVYGMSYQPKATASLTQADKAEFGSFLGDMNKNSANNNMFKHTGANKLNLGFGGL